MQTMLQDLRYSARMLLKNPGFTLIAVLTLSLGIGANTAIFSVVDGVLLRPLPYKEPARLVRVYSEFPTMNLRKFWVSPPEYVDIQKEAKSWESIGAWTSGGVNLSTSGEPIRVTSASITRSLIDTLGVQPALGRNFTPEEDLAGGPRATIISYALWHRAFGGQSDIIGKEIRINARPFNVVGVMPQGFVFPPGANDPVDVWAPFQFNPASPGGRGSHFLNLIGRLKPGTTIEQARSEMLTLEDGWRNENRSQHLLNQNTHPVLMFSLHEDVTGAARPAVLMLLVAVAFVLLIACANVASLLLARAEARHREFAVRLALGAGRKRLLRQFLTEGLVLTLLGAGCGVLLAQLGLKAIMAAAPDSVPRTSEIGIDLLALAFTLGISILAVFVFAVAPMAQLRERNLAGWLHSASLRTTGASSHFLRKVLVITEIALALVLVVGSGLMIRAFWKLRHVELGFNPQGVLSFSVTLPSSSYRVPDQLRFSQSLQEKLSALPGVKSAAIAGGLPPLRPINANDTGIEGFQPTPDGPAQNVDYWNVVSEDYFKTMGIRLTEGRAFELSDRNENAQRVVVINQTMARRFWNGSPIGRRVNPMVSNQPNFFTIVGVVEDTKNLGVDKPAGTELYFPEQQVVALFGGNTRQNFVVRTEGDPAQAVAAVRSAVHSLDPALPIYGMRPMTDLVANSLVRPRFLSMLLTVFSVIALTLAAVGIYGVMAYSVSQRTQEIGVRMALGARTSDVLKMVLGQGAMITAIGVGIGLAGAFALAFALTRVMSTLLFGVSVTDPATFAAVVALLAIVALLACYLPARRATKVDPMVALRYE
ncbi:MAG TPA: ABC transporter permease [Blastocatellia bacterium]|nr:ABC transporter permease [Blastocatellia bacterium]